MFYSSSYRVYKLEHGLSRAEQQAQDLASGQVAAALSRAFTRPARARRRSVSLLRMSVARLRHPFYGSTVPGY